MYTIEWLLQRTEEELFALEADLIKRKKKLTKELEEIQTKLVGIHEALYRKGNNFSL